MKLFCRTKKYCLIILAALGFSCVSCASIDYVQKNYEKNIELLKTCAPYTKTPDAVTTTGTLQSLKKEYLVDEARAAQIRKYFKENTELDLEALAASQKSTLEKSLELACFVAKNIPHNNQKEWLAERNAITLWEYSRRVPTGFNCRWHATILSELLLSIGIRNNFVTCLPYDKDDGDCHVVNIVWLPELSKWAMLDSDMTEYVTDDDGMPLSLQEMRQYYQTNRDFTVNVLPGFEEYWVAKPSGQDYMHAYWAKNLYWFALYDVYAFDLEGERNPDGTKKVQANYMCLVPPDYDCTSTYNDAVITSNEELFWAF